MKNEGFAKGESIILNFDIYILHLSYHDDFFTPGIFPSEAISLKQIRHSPKSLIYPFPLPHLKQRCTTRVLYFGFLFDRAITDFFAIIL